LDIKAALAKFVRKEDSPLCWEHASSQYLWGNDHILYEGRVLYYTSFAKHGIQNLCDIVDVKTRKWKSLYDISRVTSLRPIDVQRLLKRLQEAIPMEWFLLPNGSVNDACSKLILESTDGRFSYTLRNKGWYNIIMLQNITIPKAVTAWERTEHSPQSWDVVWKNIHSPHIPNRARDVVWRLLHRKLWVGPLLKKVGIANNDHCLFCTDTEETIIHLFTECLPVSQFWMYIEQIFRKIVTVDINIIQDAILFHELDAYNLTNNAKKILLFCLSVAVWAIWKHRCTIVSDSYTGVNSSSFEKLKCAFRALFSYCLKCEFHDAVTKNRLHSFEVIWCSGDLISIVSTNLIFYYPP
jgi:hypothetical protein